MLPVLLALACSKESESAPAPHPCAGFAKFMLDTCERIFFDASMCTIVEAVDHPLGPGRQAQIDDAVWFIHPDGSVASENPPARDLCPVLPTVADFRYDRARKAAEGVPDGDPTRCSVTDLDVANFVRADLEPLGGYVPSDVLAKVFRHAAERALPAAITPAQAQERWSKARRVCPEGL